MAADAEGTGKVLLTIANSINFDLFLRLRNGTGWKDDGSPACR